VHWFAGKEIELERLLVAVAKFGKPFAVWLRHFVGGTQETAGVFKERAVEGARRTVGRCLPSAEALEVIVNREDFRGRFLRLLDSIVRGKRAL
jgi:hypothetical protein